MCCVFAVCCVCMCPGSFVGGEGALYFRERYYPRVFGWGRLRVEIDLVLVSHVACGILLCCSLRVARD